MSDSDVQQFDEERADAYDERIRRLAPGYDTLHDTLPAMLDVELPEEAEVLVVGAGTGTEVVRLGRAHPEWTLTAVDPSAEMLEKCRDRVDDAGLNSRVTYICEPVEALSDVRHFDAATAIVVAHFLPDAEAKRNFFGSIASHLRAAAPFVWADLYRVEPDETFHRLWAAWRSHLTRAGMSEEDVEQTFERIEDGILFTPEGELEAIVRDVGFTSFDRFHQSLLWGAWMARKD